MKKQFLFLSIVMFGALNVLAQTPYDNFAPEQGVKSIIELPQAQFRVENTDTDSELRYAEFDKNTLSLNILDENNNVIKTLVFDPNEKKFLTIDPLAEKYYSISPYAYCANNPIRFIDPNGMDIWEINSQGEIINRIKDKTQDAFYMVDKNGSRTFMTDDDGNKYYNSVSFEYGTITDVQKAGGWLFRRDATNFSVTSEAAGADLFKFFADNTKVEFGLINTSDNGSLVMTNHKASSVEASMTAQKMSDKGQTVTSILHNHPNNSQPSGFGANDRTGDKFAAARYLPNVDRYVYHARNGALIQYDNNRIYGTTSWGVVFPTSAKRAPIFPVRGYPGVGLPPF